MSRMARCGTREHFSLWPSTREPTETLCFHPHACKACLLYTIYKLIKYGDEYARHSGPRTPGPQDLWSEQAASGVRRTARAVKVARRMAEHASASLPAQMQTWKETRALYRRLG